jgi:hypothetical protein
MAAQRLVASIVNPGFRTGSWSINSSILTQEEERNMCRHFICRKERKRQKEKKETKRKRQESKGRR